MHHGQLNDIRRGALDGCVAGHALAGAAHLEVGACQLRQRAAAAKQRFYIALLFGVFNAVLHVAVHFREGIQIRFQESICLLDRNAEVLAQRERALAVHDAKVDGLGGGAQLMGDIRFRDVVDLGRGGAVNVCPGQKRLLHGFIACNVGQNAQFDLGIVGVHQRFAGGGHKVAAQAAAQLGADGNVLQIRFSGADASRAGFGLDKGGMDASVRPQGFQQALHIGGKQLGIGAVLQNIIHRRAVGAQAFQRFGVGGIAAGRFFAGRQAQLVKQGFAQLLGAVQIELVPDLSINVLQNAVQLGAQAIAELADALGVHRKADALHVGQHAGQRQLHRGQQVVAALLVQLSGKHIQQGGKRPGIRRGGAGKGRGSSVFCRQLPGLVITGRRIQ